MEIKQFLCERCGFTTDDSTLSLHSRKGVKGTNCRLALKTNPVWESARTVSIAQSLVDISRDKLKEVIIALDAESKRNNSVVQKALRQSNELKAFMQEKPIADPLETLLLLTRNLGNTLSVFSQTSKEKEFEAKTKLIIEELQQRRLHLVEEMAKFQTMQLKQLLRNSRIINAIDSSGNLQNAREYISKRYEELALEEELLRKQQEEADLKIQLEKEAQAKIDNAEFEAQSKRNIAKRRQEELMRAEASKFDIPLNLTYTVNAQHQALTPQDIEDWRHTDKGALDTGGTTPPESRK